MYNATVVNAVHSAISAIDALTVFYRGVRHAGERHEDAVALFQTLPFEKEELDKKTRQLSRLLSVKTSAEYHEHLMTQRDASTALQDSDRILRWVKGLLEVR